MADASVTARMSPDGKTILDFNLPRGPKGDKGDKGDIGPLASLTVGTVETVAGSPLDSEIVADQISTPGTPANTVLNAAIEQVVNVLKYGAVGDGVTDDNAALASAVTEVTNLAAAGKRARLYLPPGKYNVDRLVFTSANGFTVSGPGELIGRNPGTAGVARFINCSNFTVQGLTVRHANATVRNSIGHGIYVTGGADFNLIGNKVTSVAAAGIFVEGTRFTLSGNRVESTLADGIHLTNACTDGAVTGNTVNNSGDDSIAVVSYLTDTATCKNITVTSNAIRGSLTRGITVVGGENIAISGNTIDGTASSGILVNQDSAMFFTREVDGVAITGNTISNAGSVLPRRGNQIGVEVGAGSKNVTVSANIIRGAYQAGVVSVVSGVIILGNRVTNSGDSGIRIGGSRNLVASNIVSNSGQYGIVSIASGLTELTVSGNTVIDSNTLATAGVDGINIGLAGVVTNATVIGNTVIDGAARTERAIELNASGGTLTGNSAVGVTLINVIGGGNIERGPLSAASAPTNTFYKAGTTHYDTATSKLYVYNGTAWKSVTLA